MVLRELLVKLGLSVDEASFAKGQLAANAISKAFTMAMDVAIKAVGGLEDALIGFNARAEQSKMGLAGIAGMNLKLPWEEAKKAADELFKGLQEDAAKTPAETSELVDFAQQIAGAYLAAGKNMQDLRQFTTQAVVAAKMLRAEGTAATDIKQAIQGRVGVKDMFAANVIKSLGMSIEQFNAKTMEERADLFAKGLNNPTIRAAMEEYEGQWDGITSTLKDNLSIIMGDVGKPLFDYLKKTISEVGKWVIKNKDQITKFLRSFSATVIAVSRQLIEFGKWAGHAFSTLWDVIGKGGQKAFLLLGAAFAAFKAGPLGIVLAGITMLLDVLDDIRGYKEGEDSLFGTFKDEIASWLKPNDRDPWWLVALKDMVELMAKALGLAKELGITQDTSGSTQERRGFSRVGQVASGVVGANPGKIGASLDRQFAGLSGLRGKLARGEMRGKSNWYGGTSYEDISDPVERAKAAAAYAEANAPYMRTKGGAGGVSVNAPLHMNVTQAPGESGQEFANRVMDQVREFWGSQLEEATAGAGR